MVRRYAYFSVMYSSQMHVNSFSLNKVTSLIEVVTNKSIGKLRGDEGLRLNTNMSRLPVVILYKVTIRNLLRYVGTPLYYESTYINGQVTK